VTTSCNTTASGALNAAEIPRRGIGIGWGPGTVSESRPCTQFLGRTVCPGGAEERAAWNNLPGVGVARYPGNVAGQVASPRRPSAAPDEPADPPDAAYAAPDEPAAADPDGPEDGAPDFELSPMLPWPPPSPSSQVVIDRNFLVEAGRPPATLADVDGTIQAALGGAGYSGSTYWSVPGGFAIVTPLEQTDANGAPLGEQVRWIAAIAGMRAFSLSEYLRALFTAPPGYFRVLVFVVSPQPFAPTDAPGNFGCRCGVVARRAQFSTRFDRRRAVHRGAPHNRTCL
jgi:hypothetical protein